MVNVLLISILVLMLLVWGVTGLVSRQIRRVARGVVAAVEHIQLQQHEYRRVDPQSFAALDLGFYDTAQAWLEENGFAPLGDVENLTLRQAPGRDAKDEGLQPTFMRILASPEGACAAIYHARFTLSEMKGRALVRRTVEMKHLELATEFDDGTTLCTGVQPPLALPDDPPEFRRRLLPPETEWVEILSRHRSEVQSLLGLYRNASPRVVSTLDEWLEQQRRNRERVIEFRHRVGVITEAELRRAAGPERAWLVPHLMREVKRLRRD